MKFLFCCLCLGQIVLAQSDPSPVISNLRVSPLVGYRGTLVTLLLTIRDPQGTGDIENTLYLLREEVEGMKVPIYDDGSHGDQRAGDGEYIGRLEVPPNAAIQTHRFQVYVLDKEGHKSNMLFYELRVLSRGDLL